MNRLLPPQPHEAVGRFVEAYRNPRLQDPEADYLSSDHLHELREDSEIVKWEAYRPPSVFPGIGTINHIAFATRSGHGYKALEGIPEVQRTDSLGLATSPLGTSAGGINAHMLLNYMRAGNFVGFMANEGSYEPFEERRRRTVISLASTAAALLAYGERLQDEQQKQGYDIDERKRFTYGPSRAGATALVANTLDQHFSQDIKASDVIAPSPALKIDSADKWFHLAEQVAKEPANAAFIIAKLGLVLALKYGRSISLKRCDIASHLEICGALFNGELGIAAERIPHDKLIRVTEYDRDITCNDGGLESILTTGTHANVAFEQLKGIHFSIADRNKTLPVMMGFNKAYQEYDAGQLRNPQDLFARAKQLAPRQFPIAKEYLPAPESISAA